MIYLPRKAVPPSLWELCRNGHGNLLVLTDDELRLLQSALDECRTKMLGDKKGNTLDYRTLGKMIKEVKR